MELFGTGPASTGFSTTLIVIAVLLPVLILALIATLNREWVAEQMDRFRPSRPRQRPAPRGERRSRDYDIPLPARNTRRRSPAMPFESGE